MPVKSTTRVRDSKYPLLMGYNLCGERYVVLMSEPGVGMVVESNSPDYPIGVYKDDWKLKIGNLTYFTPCSHVIELMNTD